jgi:hypothetical protein
MQTAAIAVCSCLPAAILPFRCMMPPTTITQRWGAGEHQIVTEFDSPHSRHDDMAGFPKGYSWGYRNVTK